MFGMLKPEPQIPDLPKVDGNSNMQEYYLQIRILFEKKGGNSQKFLVLNSMMQKFPDQNGENRDKNTVSEFINYYQDEMNINFGIVRNKIAKNLIDKITESTE